MTQKNSIADVIVTKTHFVYAKRDMAVASHVKTKDELLLAVDTWSQVIVLSSFVDCAIFYSQILHGFILLDSVRVSTFSSVIEMKTAYSPFAPFRAACPVWGSHLSGLI